MQLGPNLKMVVDTWYNTAKSGFIVKMRSPTWHISEDQHHHFILTLMVCLHIDYDQVNFEEVISLLNWWTKGAQENFNDLCPLLSNLLKFNSIILKYLVINVISHFKIKRTFISDWIFHLGTFITIQSQTFGNVQGVHHVKSPLVKY